QSRFLTVGTLTLETLQDAWARAKKGMEFAINFLKTNAGLDSPALLSSPFLVVSLAYYGAQRDYQLSKDEADRLRYWVRIANAKGRYSRGSSETILDQDLATLRDGGEVDMLVDRLRQQVGRLDVNAEELRGRNQRSALFKTMFLAFRADHARDWSSNLAIALGHRGTQHRLQFHHIFPKAVLKGRYTAREADDIANLAFVGGKTNRQIRDKLPRQYFPPLIGKAGVGAFEAQCIPTGGELLEVEGYKRFLVERRRRIAERLNVFLGTS